MSEPREIDAFIVTPNPDGHATVLGDHVAEMRRREREEAMRASIEQAHGDRVDASTAVTVEPDAKDDENEPEAPKPVLPPA